MRTFIAATLATVVGALIVQYLVNNNSSVRRIVGGI